ncbi:MAG TPA: DUF2141 domain-containing protein [Ohtaekwangia sp.]|uniref:DUF2141 domain-containing protein n=1 Tax=Ohtaekwangia sp. TaxID=2066019 RepID=UPI002F94C594
MKKLIMVCVVIGVTASVMAQTKLQVTVKKIKGHKGDILVGLFDNDKDFPRNAKEGKIAKATSDQVTVVFENLKPGKYAISVLHDANQNKDMDKNKLGIPKEGFGFSNNAMGAVGPPSFEKAQIDLLPDQKDLDISIDMKYM